MKTESDGLELSTVFRIVCGSTPSLKMKSSSTTGLKGTSSGSSGIDGSTSGGSP